MRINGIDLRKYSKMERLVLVTLGLASPRWCSIEELIEVAYPNPYLEPDYASNCIKLVVMRIRKKLGADGWHIPLATRKPGYILERKLPCNSHS